MGYRRPCYSHLYCFTKIFLGLIFVIFTIMRPIPQFIMNRRLLIREISWSKLRNQITWACLDSARQLNPWISGHEAMICQE